jgi:cobalt-precorrin-5B (C1)-methyltransferase
MTKGIGIKDAPRSGFTTGTTASAAAKGAAIYYLTGKAPEIVDVRLPDGASMSIPVLFENGLVGVKKDAGDDPDVTHGLKIFASVKPQSLNDEIIVKGGQGVGVATKPGLQVPVGQWAINPVPRAMICANILEVVQNRGFEATIIIPEGEKIAQKTFNPKLGILGGLSVLGTTGIVEPMSLEALKKTIQCEIDVAVACGSKTVALTPGKIGESALRQTLASSIPIIQMSNFAEFAFSYLHRQGVQKAIIGGHPGKLAKIALGHFNTHSAESPSPVPYVRDLLGLDGQYATVEGLIEATPESEKFSRFSRLAARIGEAINRAFQFNQLEVYLFDMKKRLIGKWSV